VADRPTGRTERPSEHDLGVRREKHFRPLPCEDDHLSLESLETQPREVIVANVGKAEWHRENHSGALRALGVCDRDGASGPLASGQREGSAALLLDLLGAQCQAEPSKRFSGTSDGSGAGGAH
jgi:hypothetical protein